MANPFAWLGLLKWSLSYTDGNERSESNSDATPLSDEDRKFLENVMKDGIIDEGTRMREILSKLTQYLDSVSLSEEANSIEKIDNDEVIDLLWELRDIVGLIDYSNAFVAIGGLPFLVGCAHEVTLVDSNIRGLCLVLLATLAQNNPSVQNILLQQKHIEGLIDLYFDEQNDDIDGKLRGRIVQATSCSIRGIEDTEEMFCQNEKFRTMIETGIGANDTTTASDLPPESLRQRCVFLLQALLCSDTSSSNRINLFTSCINQISTVFLDPNKETSLDIRETCISFLVRLFQQKKAINTLLENQNQILAVAVPRISHIRSLEGQEKAFFETELELLESLVVELARVDRDEEVADNSSAPLMLLGRPADDSGETLAQ